MSFGQPSGPQATSRQVRDLIDLLESAGYSGFKDARGPFQLTQRQAGGRFTRDEAEALHARLQAEVDGTDPDGAPPDPADRGVPGPTRDAATDGPGAAQTGSDPTARSAPTRRQTLARQLEQVPEDLLVTELRRRGWSVDPPPG